MNLDQLFNELPVSRLLRLFPTNESRQRQRVISLQFLTEALELQDEEWTEELEYLCWFHVVTLFGFLEIDSKSGSMNYVCSGQFLE